MFFYNVINALLNVQRQRVYGFYRQYVIFLFINGRLELVILLKYKRHLFLTVSATLTVCLEMLVFQAKRKPVCDSFEKRKLAFNYWAIFCALRSPNRSILRKIQQLTNQTESTFLCQRRRQLSSMCPRPKQACELVLPTMCQRQNNYLRTGRYARTIIAKQRFFLSGVGPTENILSLF